MVTCIFSDVKRSSVPQLVQVVDIVILSFSYVVNLSMFLLSSVVDIIFWVVVVALILTKYRALFFVRLPVSPKSRSLLP